MLGAGETQVFASVLHGPKDVKAAPDVSVRRSGSVETILLHQLNILEEVICRQSRAELKNLKSFDFECSNEKRLTSNALAAHKVFFHGFMCGIFESLME